MIKGLLREARNRVLLRSAVFALRRPLGPRGTRLALAALRRGWGNGHYSGHLEYLVEAFQRASRASGPILECGSGCSTIALAVAAQRAGVRLTTLEHSREWFERIEGSLRELGLDSTCLVWSSLRDFGEFEWYDVTVTNGEEPFAVVVCDGPPGGTRGGRAGLLARMKARLARDTVILLDDAARDGEQQIISNWAESARLDVTMSTSAQGTFATITLL